MEDNWKHISDPSLRKEFARYAEHIKLGVSINGETTYIGKLKKLKEYYHKCENEILALAKRDKTAFFQPYPIDWYQLFTPIEVEAWNAIRTTGHIVLYPQYPVLNYFIDFANPYLKIGLELDGKDFHSIEKDYKRDMILKESGWKIYRITGSEMVNTHFKDWHTCRDEDLTEDEYWDNVSHWILNIGDGIIEAIKQIYFVDYLENAIEYRNSDDYDYSTEDYFVSDPFRFKELFEQTLSNHSLV